jgi:CRISPR/Cas system CSM-associated protein Csm2 small subunit
MKWIFPIALFMAISSEAGPRSALMNSLDNLKAVIVNKLDLDTANCRRGIRDSCQDALLDNVRLNKVNSEISLRKLARTVRSSSETSELIDDAIDKLSDVDQAVDEIEEKLQD